MAARSSARAWGAVFGGVLGPDVTSRATPPATSTTTTIETTTATRIVRRRPGGGGGAGSTPALSVGVHGCGVVATALEGAPAGTGPPPGHGAPGYGAG